MARPRTPKAVKQLTGTYRKDRDRELDVPTVDALQPPTWLVHGEALREWHRVTQELAEVGLLSAMDQSAIAFYCMAFADWLDAVKILEVEGMITRSKTGVVKQHPAIAIRNEAWRRLMTASQAFGMSPTARTKLGTSTAKDEKRENPFLSVAPRKD